MTEYMLQIATKLEISSEGSAIWEMSDICNVLKESLTQLQRQENQDDKDTVDKQILHFVEYLIQYPPMIHKEKITSYFHKDGLKHWFYIGNVDDTGKPMKYEAVSLYYPGEDITGSLCLDHVIKVPEGEFKVLGVAKFSSLKGTQHKIKKMTMPDAIKEYMSAMSVGTTQGNKPLISVNKLKTKKAVTFSTKKKILKKKKSGVSTFLKYLAPGAGSLLVPNHYQEPSNTDATTDDDDDQQHTPGTMVTGTLVN